MTIRLQLIAPALGLALLAACGSDTTEPSPVARCNTGVAELNLEPGDFAEVDPATSDGCIRVPRAGAGGAEYLYVALSTTGDSTPYSLQSGSAPLIANRAPISPLPSPTLSAFARPSPAGKFHEMLRHREALMANRGAGFVAAPPAFSVAPVVGDKRTFSVCNSTVCNGFVSVTATAKHVGQRVAIYIDDTIPAGGYTQADIDSVGMLFDQYLYPIDTTAFGRESDLDNNGVVVVLLTDAVNRLSGNCPDQSVILGYFFGNDLVDNTGSNHGEVFYGLVPDPGGSVAGCSVPKDFATRTLAPVFIHEFQHMISFNQHVLIRRGATEATWLNEGLSHFAEELGARLIPDAATGVASGTRFTQFAFGDVDNGYNYLLNQEATSLIEPAGSTGTLDERGANWLFVRWLVDQFGADEIGTQFTRSLVATAQIGVANVEARTGEDFGTLLLQWQLANYLDNLPGFTPSSPRLQYLSWNFRNTFSSLNSQSPQSFPKPYPLVPDSAVNAEFSRTGTLRIGSGPHVLMEQGAGSQGLSLQLMSPSGSAIPAGVAARAAVARIR